MRFCTCMIFRSFFFKKKELKFPLCVGKERPKIQCAVDGDIIVLCLRYVGRVPSFRESTQAVVFQCLHETPILLDHPSGDHILPTVYYSYDVACFISSSVPADRKPTFSRPTNRVQFVLLVYCGLYVCNERLVFCFDFANVGNLRKCRCV